MGFSKITSAQANFLNISLIDIEVDLSRGLNSFSIVGLADKAIEESKERVSASIKNSGFESPKSRNQRTTVSLAPANLRKEGPNFDLSIALAYLLATGDIDFDSKDKIFLGELSLDGTLRPIKKAFSLVVGAKKLGIKEIYLPFQNTIEASVVSDIIIFGVKNLREVIDHLDKKEKDRKTIEPVQNIKFSRPKINVQLDFQDIKGQELAKRALEIAGAGGHNIMLYGPPGTGKTMLAKAFPHILPTLSFEEVVEVTSIYSYLGLSSGLVLCPPFRSPHHSSSHIAIIGGGTSPKPGEITLSHRGVLFMDEFPEFDSSVIESLRQPLEDQKINISRARGSVVFPSDFILVSSMNLCPCGFLGSSYKDCVCTYKSIQKYQNKISGPIADRIDMWVEVSEIDYKKMSGNFKCESTYDIQKRVYGVRKIQKERFLKSKINFSLNSRMSTKDILEHCSLSETCRKLLDNYAEKLHLSPRVYHKLIKLARTIADLDNKKDIEEPHLLEAFQYRPKIKD